MSFLRDPVPPPRPEPSPRYPGPLTADRLAALFGGSSDLVRRPVRVAGRKDLTLTLLGLDGMVSGDHISENIIRPLLTDPSLHGAASEQELMDRILAGGVYSFEVGVQETLDGAALALTSGNCVLVFNALGKAVSFDAKGFDFRGISEPGGENILKGSKEGFIENIRMNTALVRRRIHTPDLRIQEQPVGRQTKTVIAVFSVEGLTDPKLTEQVLRRIRAMDVDGVLTAATLEEALTERPRPLFPTLLSTERSNQFCAGLLAGRVGIMADGLPLGYLAPAGFVQHMRSMEEYTVGTLLASFLTLLRYLCLGLSLLLPALFLSVVLFHREMLPPELTLSLQNARAEVPLPLFGELLLMLLAFEVLLEAGVQMPQEIGQAVSIVGGLILGSAAVEAKVVSPIVVIVVALTGVCGFVMPSQDLSGAIRLWRMGLTVLGGLGGLFLVSLGVTGLLCRLCAMESCGVPYLAPFTGGGSLWRMAESVTRPPLSTMKRRDPALHPLNRRKRK